MENDKMEFPAMSPQGEVELPATISSLEEDEMQIGELTEIEENYRSEVASHAKQILEQVGDSFKIEPASLAEVFVNPDGKIALMDGKMMIAEIPLEELPGQVLARILVQVMPEVKRLLAEQRQGLTKSSTLLEKSAKEFRKVTAAIPTRAKKSSDASSVRVQMSPKDSSKMAPTQDAIKVALSSKEK